MRRPQAPNPLPPDIRAASLRLARVFARQAAREHHARANETGSNLRKVFDGSSE